MTLLTERQDKMVKLQSPASLTLLYHSVYSFHKHKKDSKREREREREIEKEGRRESGWGKETKL
jgi:hypothetical protein